MTKVSTHHRILATTSIDINLPAFLFSVWKRWNKRETNVECLQQDIMLSDRLMRLAAAYISEKSLTVRTSSAVSSQAPPVERCRPTTPSDLPGSTDYAYTHMQYKSADCWYHSCQFHIKIYFVTDRVTCAIFIGQDLFVGLWRRVTLSKQSAI